MQADRPSFIHKTGDWSPLLAFSGKKRRMFPSCTDLAVLGSLILLFFFIYRKAALLPQYDWNWRLLADFIFRRNAEGEIEAGLLLVGLFTTLRVGIWSFAVGVLLGLGPGIYFSKKKGLITLPHIAILNIIRNSPPLVLLFCVYFFAGNIFSFTPLENIYRSLAPAWQAIVGTVYAPQGQLDRMTSAVVALGLYQSAYMAEIFRAGVESVDRGQMDAALALGFSRFSCMRLVILPQAARLIIPPMTSQAITSLKDSALASLISLPDLTFQGLEIMAVSSMTFEVWTTCGFLYLLFGGICAISGRFFEKKYSFRS